MQLKVKCLSLKTEINFSTYIIFIIASLLIIMTCCNIIAIVEVYKYCVFTTEYASVSSSTTQTTTCTTSTTSYATPSGASPGG